MNILAIRFLILATVCALVTATPIERIKRATDKCASECSGTSHYKYEIGKSYNYQYETEIKVKLAGVSQNEASVKIEANVQISVIEQCEYSLKLTQVKITGPTTADLGSDWTQELTKYVTRFSFDDGDIGEICPKDDEPTWSVNIKRAILSAFQNAQTGRSDTFESYEEDVSGRCPTTFEIRENSGTTVEKTITKRKNLVSCFNRQGNHTALRIMPYEVQSAIQSHPLINSTQICKQTIRGGKLVDTSCEEKHILKRFNNRDKGGVMGTATQKLHFLNENGNVARGDVGHREKLYFDHKDIEEVESKQGLTDARQNLKDLCKTSKDEVRPETPGLFNELVYNLRKLSFADLKTINQEWTGSSAECEFGKQSFLNALPMCGDTACIQLVADILKTNINQLTMMQKRVYFTSMALIPHVTKEMIVAVTPLIDSVPKEGLLGLSTLVHSYCRENPSCDDLAEVKAVLQKLTAQLGTQCATTDDAGRDTMLYALKALGNIGHSTENIDKRINCLKTKTNPIDIRLAAVQSLRRTPCAARVAPLKERFADIEEDVEIRITSFLTLIKCATPEIVQSVKEILEKEPIHQVGSFVRTYFEQMSTSSDPCKQDIHNLLSSQHIRKRFNSDPRKYSRFMETSPFSKAWNFGGHAESALIFTPDGYIPRQGFLNLTIDAFGASINLLEIGGRAEGSEKLVDDLFGPNGYFTNPTGFYFKPQKKPHKNPKVVELQEKFGKDIKKNPNLDISYYVRIFGDEIAFKNVRNINLMERYTSTMQKIMGSLKMGQEANVKLARANQLVSHYISLPTVAGLPLHIGGNMTIAVNVDFNGKLDLSKLMKERNAELRASIKPSAAILHTAMFAVHVGHSKFGLSIQERIHSSTAANVVMELRNGEAFKASLELPKQKNEILQYDIRHFTIKNNVPIEEAGIVKDRVSGSICSPDRLNKWIGFKVCHEASFPNATSVPDAPYFPLTGPVRYAVTLEKTDPNLKTYEFSANWKNTPTSRTAKLQFNTPGSSVDREIALDFDYQRGKSLNVNYKSPLKKINAVGTLEVAGQKQNGKINIKVDDTKDYTLIGSQEKVPSANGGRTTTYKGEIARPGQPSITLSAVDNLEMPQSGLFKRTLDFNAVNLYTTPVEFKSSIERTGQRQGTINYNLKHPKLNSKVATKITLDGQQGAALRLRDGALKTDLDLSIEYQRPNIDSEAQKFDFKYNLDYAKQGPQIKFVEAFTTKCSRYPKMSVDYKLNIDKKSDQTEIKLQAVDGLKRDILFDFASKKSADNRQEGKATLKSNVWNFDHKADFTYQNNLPRQFGATIKMDTPQTKNINVEAKFNRQPDQAMEGEAKLNYPGRDIRLFKKLTKIDANKHKSQVIVQWQTDKKIQLDSDITYNPQQHDYELKTVAQGIDGQSWTFNKKVKIGDDLSVKSLALLQKGQQTVYDWKLDLTKEGPKKQKLQAQLRSDYGGNKIDVTTDGSVEDTGAGRKIIFASKKDQKDFLKGELIVPKAVYDGADQQKQVKVDLQWDRSTILVDYQRTKPKSDQIQIDTTWKIDVPQYQPAVNRKLSIKVSTGDVKSANVTLFKDNVQVLDGSIGSIRKLGQDGLTSKIGREGAVDFVLKTSAPWTTRHVSGLATHTITDTAYDFAIRTENHQEKRKFGFRVGSTKQGETKRTFETELNANEKQWITKHTYERNDAESLKKLNGEIEFSEGAKKQKNIHEFSLKKSPTIRLTSKFSTPNSDFVKTEITDFDGSIELSRQGKQHKHNVDLKWNQNQNFKVQVKGDVAADMTDIDGSLQSTLTGLKSGLFTLKSDFQRGRDFEARLEWNDVNKLRSHHKRTTQGSDEKWSTGVEATIPNTANYKAAANVDWNTQTGKYKVNTESQLNGNGAYKVNADFDTKSKEGTIEVATPTDQLKSAKAQVTKLGENEYELKMVQNAQSVADVKATLKLESDKQKLAIEVKNIQKPFKTQFEHEWTEKHFLIGGELNYDLQDPKKAYGIKLVCDKANENSRDIQASLSYPSRQLKLRHQCTNQLPQKLDWNIEVQANADQPGTKVQLNYERPDPNQYKVGMHVTKDKMPGFHATGNVQRSGNCKTFILEECKINGGVQVKYSDDETKTVSHNFKINREIVEQRPKYSYLWETEQKAFNINLRHYATVLVAKCLTRTSDCKRQVEAGFEFLDKQKQKKVYKWKLDTDSVKTATSEFTCPRGTVLETITYDGDQVKVLMKRDQKDVYELVAGYDRPDKEIRLEVKDLATSEVIIHAGARKPSPDSFELKLWHSQNKQKVEDINVITSLRENSRVRSRLFVRPGFKTDYPDYLKQKWQQRVGAEPLFGNGTNTELADLMKSHEAMKEDYFKTMKPLVDHWQQQQDAIGRELGINFSGLRALIGNYTNTIREIKRVLQNYFNEIFNRLTSGAPSRTLKKMYDDFQQYAPQAIDKLKRLIEAVSTNVEQLFNAIMSNVTNWRKTRDDVYKNMRIDELKTYLKNMYDELRQSPIIQKLIQFFTNLGSNAPDLSWERLKNTALNLNDQAMKTATETRKQVEDQAAVWRDELLKNEDTKAITKFLQEAYNRIVWHLSNMGPGEKVKGFYAWITQEFYDVTSGGGLAKQYLPSIKESNPEKGIYVVEATIPGEFKSLDDITSKFEVNRLRQIKDSFTERMGSLAQDADYAVRDTMINFHPSSMGRSWKTPLSSTAVLVGDQHFVTFDDEEYDFAGECDYLLARDFENGEFSIFVNFEKRNNRVARKSLTVEYLENKVEISYDNKVKINDKDTELPWHSVSDETGDVILQVSRRDHSVVVKSIDGLIVDCDGHYYVCRITVPKRFHGKSGGLLGTNDFESYNELTKPDHKRTTNVGEFAKEWSTSAGCRVTDNQAKQEKIESGPLYDECNNLLNSSSSPLRACFHRLPPYPYLTMCLTDAKQARPDAGKQGLCNTTAAYIEACEEQGVAMDLPSQCVRCDVAGTVLSEDETKRLEGDQVPNYADVIFVVEERKCMAWTKTQLPVFAQKIQADLSSRYDVRYGLIGFNGDGVHYAPHFQTGQGSLVMSLDGIRTAASQLTFSDKGRRLFQDPLLAVKFAADHFPFRAGTRKLVVLFACEECGGVTVDYFDLQAELLQMAVSLQLVTSEKIELSAPGAPEMIAVDASILYGADLSEKTDLRSQLVEPHDSCTVLVQETNGTVFSYSEKNLPAITNLLTKKLVKSAAGSQCQICECQEHEHAPRTTCFPCEIPRPASLTRDSTGFFNNPFVRLQKWQKKAQDTLNQGLARTTRFKRHVEF